MYSQWHSFKHASPESQHQNDWVGENSAAAWEDQHDTHPPRLRRCRGRAGALPLRRGSAAGIGAAGHDPCLSRLLQAVGRIAERTGRHQSARGGAGHAGQRRFHPGGRAGPRFGRSCQSRLCRTGPTPPRPVRPVWHAHRRIHRDGDCHRASRPGASPGDRRHGALRRGPAKRDPGSLRAGDRARSGGHASDADLAFLPRQVPVLAVLQPDCRGAAAERPAGCRQAARHRRGGYEGRPQLSPILPRRLPPSEAGPAALAPPAGAVRVFPLRHALCLNPRRGRVGAWGAHGGVAPVGGPGIRGRHRRDHRRFLAEP